MYYIYARIIALFLLVSLTTVSDIRTRKIPNKLTLPFALIGIIVYAFADFPQGILTSFLGLLVGLLIFLLPYSLGYIGAGDVKLMAAIGALSNWRSVIAIALISAIFGGLLVIIIKSFRGGVWRTLKRTGRLFVFALLSLVMVVSSAPVISQKREKYRVETTATEEDYIPYALAIALGTITVIVLSWTGVLTGFVI